MLVANMEFTLGDDEKIFDPHQGVFTGIDTKYDYLSVGSYPHFYEKFRFLLISTSHSIG